MSPVFKPSPKRNKLSSSDVVLLAALNRALKACARRRAEAAPLPTKKH